MPATSSDTLIAALIDAFQDSGSSGVLLSSPRKHPRKFAIPTPDGALSLWVYIWTLTHGGRPTLRDEYRIQMTSVSSPLQINPLGYTLLLGYEPNLQMFAGFDLAKHQRFTTGSPSVQIDIKAIRTALRDGLAFDRKDNDEIAVGIRPDQILHYTANSEALHKFGKNASTFALLKKASTQQAIPEEDLDAVAIERQRVVRTVSELARSASFRTSVLHAYDRRCAITGMQLKLVEAAHILPVGAPGSTDGIKNGFCLSPTYHRAYDNALIYLNEDYIIRINPEKEHQLKELDLLGGFEAFKATVGRQVHLPTDRNLWPDTRLIKKANFFRRITIN
jgi:putative restriction endonuclease